MSNALLGIILGLWSGVAMVLNLTGIGIRTALVCGFIAGICVGDPLLGINVGATCLLFSIVYYTYGGATIPDYVTGSMFGTVVAKSAGVDAGLLVATSLALLMTQMDILGRSTTTVFQHLAEGALAQNNIKKFEMWTVMGTLPWILSRAIPVFFGMLLIDNVNKLADFANSVEWVSRGLSVVGKCLPAVGFALLLSYMDLKKYWPFLILGFVLYAYMGVGTIGLALVGLAAGALFTGIGTEGGAN